LPAVLPCPSLQFEQIISAGKALDLRPPVQRHPGNSEQVR